MSFNFPPFFALSSYSKFPRPSVFKRKFRKELDGIMPCIPTLEKLFSGRLAVICLIMLSKVALRVYLAVSDMERN